MAYFPQKEPALLNTENYKNTQTFFRELIQRHSPSFYPKAVAEIGASVGNNASEIFKNATYLNIDIQESEEIPTLVADVTAEIPLKDVCLVYSLDCFEHIDRPWLAAENLQKILRPGGLCFIGTLFSWRYHPVPQDYWRFTPAALEVLFSGLTCLETNFNIGPRRNDMRGFWGSKRDTVPVDELGGWRENWQVYYLGMKPLRDDNPPDKSHS